MTAYFNYRNVAYTVVGHLWSSDGASNNMIVSRDDGRPIRGAEMHPGMVQTGLSGQLTARAEKALQAAKDALSEQSGEIEEWEIEE